MKKFLSLLFVLACVLSTFGLTACNGLGLFEQPSEGLVYEYDTVNNTCVITSVGTCRDSVIRIGNKKDEFTVIGISAHAFENCTFIREVKLPQYIQSIGDYGFAGCTSLEEITIPEALIYLGAGCFKDSGLTSMHFKSLEGWWAGEEHIYVNDTRIVTRYMLSDYNEVVWQRDVNFDFFEYWINKIKNLF